MGDLVLRKKAEPELPFTYNIYIPEGAVFSGASADAGEFMLMPASYKMPEQEDVVDAKFDPSATEADKWDYLVAASSGFITASLSSIFAGELAVTDANAWGTRQIDKFVINAARFAGYRGKDLNGAISYLDKMFNASGGNATARMDDGLLHTFKDFAQLPSTAGLAFSLLTQFTRCSYGIDAAGNFVKADVPEGYYIGSNTCEKIFFGSIIWAFHFAGDNPGTVKGIPAAILSFLKDISALPIIADIKCKYNGDEVGFSIWLSKLLNGTLFCSAEHPHGVSFDLRAEMDAAFQLKKQEIPVIANECIVRGFYTLRRLYLEIKRNNISSLDALAGLDPAAFLPGNNRAITRMITISSGVFLAVSAAGIAVYSAAKYPGNKKAAARDFLLDVSFVGLGKFVFAVRSDAKYILKDFDKIRQAYAQRCAKADQPAASSDFDALSNLALTSEQAAILLSLKYYKVQYDIQNEKKDADRAIKEQWLAAWTASDPSFNDDFIADENMVYDAILHQIPSGRDLTWLYLIALELSVFQPYFRLSADDKNEYKNIQCKADYITAKFCKMQMIISDDDYSALNKAYQKSVAELTGQNIKMLAGTGATVAVTAVTGGLALTFAPQIAVALVGGSVAGLHGAALTSASLAMIGGGAIAAGGLGTAGGTAIITGGGALLGMVGSGVATAASGSLLTSKSYVLSECAKLLTVSRFVLISKQGRYDAVAGIARSVDATADKLGYELGESKPGDKASKEEKAGYKEQQASLACLQKCSKLLKKMAAEKAPGKAY